MIHRPYRLSEIFSSLEKPRLTPRRMQLVYPKIEQAPEMVLIEARPNYKPDLKIAPPLIMYGGAIEYTREFKNYCGLDQSEIAFFLQLFTCDIRAVMEVSIVF